MLGSEEPYECSFHNRDSCSGASGHACLGSFCFDSVCVRDGGGRLREGGERGGREGRKRKEQGVEHGAVRSPASSSPVYIIIHIHVYIMHGNTS